ncbi:MAG: DUF1501 domain-containing protein [Dermatophilaceae bacterium]
MTDNGLGALAATVAEEERARADSWSRGFTRRRLLAGGLGVGVAALSAQLSTTRVSFAAGSTGTLVVIFLRGGLDGLSVLVPADDPDLLAARPDIAVRSGSLIPFTRGFGLHPALAPLRPMVTTGSFAAVPAIATPDLSRSHFQAQTCLEMGGVSGSPSQSGWLSRVLEVSGPGTTFRALSASTAIPRSLAGGGNPIVTPSLSRFKITGSESPAVTSQALAALYTGLDHPMAAQAQLALDASATAQAIAAAAQTPAERGYPAGAFGEQLATVASLVRAGAGLRVATVDLGGWDMHTGLGTVDSGDMTTLLGSLATVLAQFFADLGAAGDHTTVVLMSEFGRRLAQNGNAGTDHGHGGVAIALGGGVQGGVHGRWPGLGSGVLDHGDVPGANDYRDFLGEVVMSRLGLTAGQLASVFPDWRVAPPGVMRAS